MKEIERLKRKNESALEFLRRQLIVSQEFVTEYHVSCVTVHVFRMVVKVNDRYFRYYDESIAGKWVEGEVDSFTTYGIVEVFPKEITIYTSGKY